MADDTPFAQAVLGRLDDLKESLGDVRADVEKLADKVEATYARESACVSRIAAEREARGESLKRLWETMDQALVRLARMETARAETIGADQVRTAIWKWVLGIFSGVAVAAIVGWLLGRASS